MKELTDFEVKALKLEGKKERLVTIGPGLLLLLREGKKGVTKTWMAEYPKDGKKVSESIGFYESPKPGVTLMSLREARAKAKEKLDKAATQNDPVLLRVAERLNLTTPSGEEPTTFEELAELWIKNEAPLRHKDGGAEAASALRRHVFPLIGELPLGHLRKGIIEAVLKNLSDQGFTRTCGVILGFIRGAVGYGMSHDWLAGDCTVRIKTEQFNARGDMRQRWLREEELKLMVHLLDVSRMNDAWKHAFWLITATGNRSDETLKAEVKHFDLAEKIWFIPSENQKRAPGKFPPPDRFVNLSDFALHQFEALLKLKGDSPYLFPKDTSRVRSGPKEEGPASEGVLTKAFLDRQTERSINRKRTKEPEDNEELGLFDLPFGHWATHDLRRTMGTHLKKLGFDNETIDKCLSHKTGTVLQRTYIVDNDRKKMISAWLAWGEYLDGLVASARTDENLIKESRARLAQVEAKRRAKYALRSATMKSKVKA